MFNHRSINTWGLVLVIVIIGWGFSILHVSPAEALGGEGASLPGLRQQVLDKPVYLPQLSMTYPLILWNGNFESGPTAWSESSLQGWPLIMYTSELPVAPHSGSWAVWLGGDNNEVAVLSQNVTVLSQTPYLVFWHYPASEEYDCNYDIAEVIVNATPVWQLGLCDSTNTYGWSVLSINLSGYIGNNITLSFRVITDSDWYSSWLLDDVNFLANPVAMPDALPAEAPAESSVPRR